MSDNVKSARLVAAWRDEEYALVVPRTDDGLGVELAKEMAHSPLLGNYITNMQIALYEAVGGWANPTDDDGNPCGLLVGPVSAFGEPVPSIPLNQFIVFANADDEDEVAAFSDVKMGDDELHAQLEAASILAEAARTIREEGESNGSAD